MNGKQKRKLLPVPTKRIPRPDIDKLTNSFNIILETFQKTGLYNDDASITNDLEETIVILKKIYTYIYNPKNSNLTYADVQIFVNRLMDKIKTLKKTVDTMNNNQNKSKQK